MFETKKSICKPTIQRADWQNVRILYPRVRFEVADNGPAHRTWRRWRCCPSETHGRVYAQMKQTR